MNDNVSSRRTEFGSNTYRVRDLLAAREAGTTATPFDGEVPGHDVLVMRLAKR